MDGSDNINLGDKKRLFVSPAPLRCLERFSGVNVSCWARTSRKYHLKDVNYVHCSMEAIVQSQRDSSDAFSSNSMYLIA